MYILKNYRLYRSNNRLHFQDSKLSENSPDLSHNNFKKYLEKQKQNSGKTGHSDII